MKTLWVGVGGEGSEVKWSGSLRLARTMLSRIASLRELPTLLLILVVLDFALRDAPGKRHRRQHQCPRTPYRHPPPLSPGRSRAELRLAFAQPLGESSAGEG